MGYGIHLHNTGREAGKLLGQFAALLLCCLQPGPETLFLVDVQQRWPALRNAVLGQFVTETCVDMLYTPQLRTQIITLDPQCVVFLLTKGPNTRTLASTSPQSNN
jgi:hypothetical protein